MGFGSALLVSIPAPLVRATATLGEHLGSGPLGLTMTSMLERGNVGAANATARLRECLGLTPRSLQRALDEVPSQVQDRWHARLYFLLPTLRVLIALLWIGSGVVGWLTSPASLAAWAPGDALSAGSLLVLARVTGTLDLLLGVLCLLRWRPRLLLTLMLVMLLGYTLGIGIIWPVHWLDPPGGLLKNLPLIAALAILLATDERR